MKYRVKERKNIITGKVAYAVERQICESTDDWLQVTYDDERNERRMAVFDEISTARKFIHEGAVLEKVADEIEI